MQHSVVCTVREIWLDHLHATSHMWPLDMVPIEAPLLQYFQIRTLCCWYCNSWSRGSWSCESCSRVCKSLLSHKVDSFFSPSSIRTVQNSLNNARMPLTQDSLPPLIKSTTEHYNSTGTHSTSFWLAFLASVQQGRALECTFISAQWHKYELSRLPEIYQKLLKTLTSFKEVSLLYTYGVFTDSHLAS